MKKNSLYLLVLLVGLLTASFVVGLVLVKPSEKGLMESLPFVGMWVTRNRQDKLPMVTDEMLDSTYQAGGVRKGKAEGNVLVYLVKGRLVEDAKVRVDGMIEGKVVVDGYLQAQPLAFLAGSMNGEVFFGSQEGSVVTYRSKSNRDVVSQMIKGKKVELEVRYDPSDPRGERMIVGLEKLAQAIQENRRYEGEALPAMYTLRLAVLE